MFFFSFSFFLLLACNSHSLVTTSGGARVLTTNTQTVRVTHTTVTADLLQTFLVLAELDVHHVGRHMLGLAGLRVTLTVQEPRRDLVLEGVSEDIRQTLDLLVRQGAGTAVAVNVGLLAAEKGEPNTDTLHHAEGEGDLTTAVDVGVQQTHDVLEVLGVHLKSGHGCCCFFVFMYIIYIYL